MIAGIAITRPCPWIGREIGTFATEIEMRAIATIVDPVPTGLAPLTSTGRERERERVFFVNFES